MTDATFHVVCHDCPFEALTSHRECAEAGVQAHRKNTGHNVEHAPIDGEVECDDCRRVVAIEDLKKDLVNAITGRRPLICQPCWHRGSIW